MAISVPQDSQNAPSHPYVDQVWYVGTSPGVPLDVETGIGCLVNSEIVLTPEEFTLCEQEYVDLYEPDPGQAVVTFEFDSPVVVGQLDIVQHSNGITKVEGFAGDSLDSMQSIGSVFGPYGDIQMENLFLEGQGYPFRFDSPTPGKFFQFVVRKTNSSDNYAAYRAFPANGDGDRYSSIPEPATAALIALGGCLLLRKRR